MSTAIVWLPVVSANVTRQNPSATFRYLPFTCPLNIGAIFGLLLLLICLQILHKILKSALTVIGLNMTSRFQLLSQRHNVASFCPLCKCFHGTCSNIFSFFGTSTAVLSREILPLSSAFDNLQRCK